MKHDVGSFTIPKPAEVGLFRDSLLVNLADAVKDYINGHLGTAYAQVNHGDGYVIRKATAMQSLPIDAMIRPQLPGLFVYREEIAREPFTIARDFLISTVVVQYIAEVPDANIEKQVAIFSYVPAAIQSMIHRNKTLDGYSLLEAINCEEVRFLKTRTSVVSSRTQPAPGFYVAEVRLKVWEIVDPAEEDTEDLLTITSTITLDGDNTGLDGYQYPLEDFQELDEDFT